MTTAQEVERTNKIAMPTFTYKALQADGAIAEGRLEAAGRPDAFRQMEGRNLRPVSLSESVPVAEQSSGLQASLSFTSQKVSAKALENFTRLLSSLLAAGVPLSRALVILYTEAASPAAAAKWKEIHDLVIDGMSLADAMAKSPDVFPRVYVAMVQAGETGGFLDVVLAQIADFQSREKELRSKVTSALLYPCILVVLALVGADFSARLLHSAVSRSCSPGLAARCRLSRRSIIGASQVVRAYGLFVAVGLFVIGLSAPQLVRLRERAPRLGRADAARCRWLARIGAQFAMARFCRMLGTLLGAGVPLVQGLNVARKSIGNQILMDAVSTSIERVQEGGRLGQSLADCRGLFPEVRRWK